MQDIEAHLVLSGRVGHAWCDGISYIVSAVERWAPRDCEDLVVETTAKTGRERRTLGSISRFLREVPDAAARKTMAVALERHYSQKTPKTALLTDSHLTRGVLTAWGWLMPTAVRAYAPDSVRDAILWIGEGHEIDVARVERFIRKADALLEASDRLARLR